MRIVRKNIRTLIQKCVAICLFCFAVSGYALTAMNEDQMSEVNGTGLAVGFNNFDFRMAPTSFIEITGSQPSTSAGNAGWLRGDARYYGFSFTGSGAGTDWYNDSCTNPDGMCPLGQGTIGNFAPVNNPYVFRAFDNPGYNPSGTLLDGGSTPTNLELVGPTASDSWRWSFWGQLEVDRDGGHVFGAPNAAVENTSDPLGATNPVFLQSQTIINGKNITEAGDPSIFRVFQTEEATPTFGFTYQSALSGDFRFSVAQSSASPDLLHTVPEFHEQEGLVFKNVDAFIPLGRLHSQFFSLNSTGANDGNFVLELSQVPSAPNAYNDIYCDPTPCTTSVDPESTDYFGTEIVTTDNPNPDTHGYIRWGNMGNPVGGTNTNNGIFFRSPGNNVTNIGVAQLDGVLIQSMRLRTLGIE